MYPSATFGFFKYRKVFLFNDLLLIAEVQVNDQPKSLLRCVRNNLASSGLVIFLAIAGPRPGDAIASTRWADVR